MITKGLRLALTNIVGFQPVTGFQPVKGYASKQNRTKQPLQIKTTIITPKQTSSNQTRKQQQQKAKPPRDRYCKIKVPKRHILKPPHGIAACQVKKKKKKSGIK